MYNENIDTVCHRKLCTKKWYNSEFSMNITEFSCLIFWTQLFPDQNVLILLVSNMHNRNTDTILHKTLCMKTWYNLKILCECC